MGWDGAGAYTRVHNFSADASSGIKILAARMDAEINDIASAIPIAWARNGQNVPTTDMPMGGRKFVNVGAPTSIGNFMRVREFIENVPIFMQDVESSADRISVSSQYFTSVSANQAPVDGTKIMVRVNSNKSSAVMYLDGHSANVEYQDGNRIAVAMVSGGIYELTYSSSDAAWKLPSPSDGRTAAEIAAGVTVVSYQYAPGNVLRYGTNTTPGTTVMNTAINAAIAQAHSGGVAVYIPTGTYLITSQLTAILGQMTIYGDGEQRSILLFNPTANGSCMKFEQTGAQVVHCTTRDIGFKSTDATYTKTALDLADISMCHFENIYIFGTGGAGAGAGAMWSGANSVGIQARGRDQCGFEGLTIFADRPILFSANPNTAADICEESNNWHFSDCYLIANGHPIVEADAGLGLQHLTFDGYQSWVGGAGGFKMNDTRAAPSVPSRNIRFDNVNTEQQENTALYAFDIACTFPINYLSFSDILIDNSSRGLKVNGADSIVCKSVLTAVPSATDAINFTAQTSRATATFIGCYLAPATGVFTMTGYVSTTVAGSVSGQPDYCGPSNAVYVASGGRVGTSVNVAVVTSAFATVTYSASMTPNAALGNSHIITATNGTAFTINAPTNETTDQRLLITIKNTSGGALGVATWNANYLMSAWTNPATGFSRSIEFISAGGGTWRQISQTGVDVPN